MVLWLTSLGGLVTCALGVFASRRAGRRWDEPRNPDIRYLDPATVRAFLSAESDRARDVAATSPAEPSPPVPALSSSAGGGQAKDEPGWLPDPQGRHDYRYWDGARWHEMVADGGAMSIDPLLEFA